MKKIVLGTLLLSIFSVNGSAIAAGRVASTAMQVSFVVQEACTVRAEGAAAPHVSCAYQAPVQVSSQATATAPLQTVAASDGQGWQIYF